MTNVISFSAYQRAQKVHLIEESCERPYHAESNIYGTELGSFCALCDVTVRIVQHPSMGDGHIWYG